MNASQNTTEPRTLGIWYDHEFVRTIQYRGEWRERERERERERGESKLEEARMERGREEEGRMGCKLGKQFNNICDQKKE